MSSQLLSIHIEEVDDQDPDPSYLEQEDMGFENRLAAYRAGEFSFIGVRAVAQIEVDGVRQEISSPGLWGIESDSGSDYLEEVGREEEAQLFDMLRELNVTLT